MSLVGISEIVSVPGRQLTHMHLINRETQIRLVNRIMKEENLNRDLAERIVDQSIGFLTLNKYEPEGHYSPSSLVDIGWHTFILYTRAYADFCQNLVGRFIHHEPNDMPNGEDIGRGMSCDPLTTVSAMKRHGLFVDEPLWLPFSLADCNDDPGGILCLGGGG